LAPIVDLNLRSKSSFLQKKRALLQFLVFVLLISSLAYSQEISKNRVRDFSQSSVGGSDSLVLKNEKGLWGEILNFPFEYGIEPALKVALYPIRPPIDYINSTHMFDRVADLVQLGPENNIILFPALNLLSANGSVVGIRYIHKKLFQKERSDRLSMRYDQYLDDDWRFSVSYSLGLPLNLSMTQKFSLNNFKNTGVNLMQGSPWEDESFYHSDYSYGFSEVFSYAFNSYLSANLRGGIERFDFSGPGFLRRNIKDSVFLDVIDSYGLLGKGFYYPLSLSLGGGDKENTYASSYGGDWNIGAGRVFSPELGDYYSFDFSSSNYFLLGSQAYRVSRKEEKARIKKMSKFNFTEVIPFLNLKDLDKALFERRIIAQYIRFRQVFKAEDQPIMYQGYSRVGRGTPLRAYSSGTFINRGFASWGLEYRWPIIRQVDGVFFNEYAQVFSKVEEFEKGNLYNSWGFGFRVRNPDLFFLRVQIAFHGLEGGSLIMTTGSAL
jgi:hypothetical protein